MENAVYERIVKAQNALYDALIASDKCTLEDHRYWDALGELNEAVCILRGHTAPTGPDA